MYSHLVFICLHRDELVRHRDHVTIDIAHVRNFSKDLAERLVMQPAEVLPLVRRKPVFKRSERRFRFCKDLPVHFCCLPRILPKCLVM